VSDILRDVFPISLVKYITNVPKISNAR